jgi:hypothetical protein
MSEKIKNGGPAFPNVWETRTGNQDIEVHVRQGMSLRDWFAGMALQGALPGYRLGGMEGGLSQLASSCYRIADAMLCESEFKS